MRCAIVWLEQGVRCRIDELGVKRDQRRYFQNVYFTPAAKLYANLSVKWSPVGERNPRGTGGGDVGPNRLSPPFKRIWLADVHRRDFSR
jgi:hypothetical protein